MTRKALKDIINECVDKCLRKYLNESQQSNLGDFIKDLHNTFNVKLHNYNPSFDEGRCLSYITTDTFDKDDIRFQSIMNKRNVFISSIDEFDAPYGTIQVCFESKYPKDVTKFVYKSSKVLYHLTRPNFIKSIANQGLKPICASEFRRSYYP